MAFTYLWSWPTKWPGGKRKQPFLMQSHMQQPILAWTTVGGNKHNGQEAVVAQSLAVGCVSLIANRWQSLLHTHTQT